MSPQGGRVRRKALSTAIVASSCVQDSLFWARRSSEGLWGSTAVFSAHIRTHPATMETTKQGELYLSQASFPGIVERPFLLRALSGNAVLGAAVLSSVSSHSLRVLRRVVDWSWCSHERRGRSHRVEHVWSKTWGWRWGDPRRWGQGNVHHCWRTTWGQVEVVGRCLLFCCRRWRQSSRQPWYRF